MNSLKELLKEAHDILKAEGRVRDHKLLNPIIDWCDEESLDIILERYNVMTGDLFNVRDTLERIVTFIGIIARHLSETDFELQEKFNEIAKLAETLQIRLHYGIKEELFDLVLRLNDVARARARVLYNAGYHPYQQVNLTKNPDVCGKKCLSQSGHS